MGRSEIPDAPAGGACILRRSRREPASEPGGRPGGLRWHCSATPFPSSSPQRFSRRRSPVSPPAQTGYVNGIVRDPSGEGIEDALVVAFSAPWQRREETTTNGAGRFSFVGLQAGQWLFLAQRAGYSPVQAFAPVRASGLGPRVVLVMQIDPLSAPTPTTGALANVHADDLHTLLDAADALFDLGNYDRAIDAYEAVLERAPPLTSLHIQIGHAYREKQEPEAGACGVPLGPPPTRRRAPRRPRPSRSSWPPAAPGRSSAPWNGADSCRPAGREAEPQATVSGPGVYAAERRGLLQVGWAGSGTRWRRFPDQATGPGVGFGLADGRRSRRGGPSRTALRYTADRSSSFRGVCQ